MSAILTIQRALLKFSRHVSYIFPVHAFCYNNNKLLLSPFMHAFKVITILKIQL